jgi:two-component system, NtrC family, sensor histidine kinase KinB
VLGDVTNLRRLDEMKSGLLSVVSHELKTPLTSIRMAVHLLLEERIGPLTTKQTELLVAARDDSDRLHKIIEGLLDMGRLESGRVELEMQPKAVGQLIEESLAPIEASFHDRGITVFVDIPAGTPAVMVDSTRIDHVFSNLLGNALKFTPPGGKVSISAAAQDGFHGSLCSGRQRAGNSAGAHRTDLRPFLSRHGTQSPRGRGTGTGDRQGNHPIARRAHRGRFTAWTREQV